MKQRTKHLVYAVATLVGYVVGAGIFGLPFVMQRMGFLPALALMFVLTVSTGLNCLALAEILLRTKKFHCLSGLAKTYFTTWGRYIIFPILIGDFGSILAFGILGGAFLEDALGKYLALSGSLFFILFLLAGAFFIWRGYNHLGFSEIVMAAVLVAVIFLIGGASIDQVKLNNYAGMDLAKTLPAFGVLLFALDGTGGMFAIRKILARRERLIRLSVFKSYALVSVLYVIFTASIVGVFGPAVFEEAVVGVGNVLGASIEKAAVLFCVVAVFSTYIVVGSNLRHALYDDLKISKTYAWFFVWLIPLLVYMLGATSFIDIISLIGMFLAGINTAIIVLILRKARKTKSRVPEYRLRVPIVVNYVVAAAYIIAAVYGIGEYFIS